MDFSFSDLNFNSVENLPGFEARAAFTVNSASVFREDVDIVPTVVDDSLSYIPWGGDNQMTFDLLALVEKDETLATCQCFNVEVCYGSGLQYCTTEASASVKRLPKLVRQTLFLCASKSIIHPIMLVLTLFINTVYKYCLHCLFLCC